MNFLHIADVHLDQMMKNIGEDGKKRRQDILNAFSECIEFIKNRKIQYLFIAGDFYEHKYIKDTTIEFIISLFKKIPDTKIYITPGNHDPYIKDSIYDRFKFPNNVYIFKNMDIFETEDANIFGYGFTDFNPPLNVNFGNIKPIKNGKKNILIVHTDINDSKYEYDIEVRKLIKKGFDYVAMGHIHMGNYNDKSNVIYPGSFAEYNFKASGDGSTGAVFGILNENLKTELIKFDKKEYIKYELNISNENSENSLIITINNLQFKNNQIVRVVLVGEKNFLINNKFILENIHNKNIIQLEDKTKLKLDYKKYKDEISLRGIFIKKADNIIENLKKKQKILINETEIEEYNKKIELIERSMLLVLEEMNNI